MKECLMRRAIFVNLGWHIMRVTIEIADDLFLRVKELARKEKTTFRALTEAGLRLVLKQKEAKTKKWRWKPITRGGGMTEEFRNAGWETIRDESYRGRGA